MMAMGFQGFAFVAHLGDGMWVSMVKAQKGKVRTVSIGEKVHAMSAADDFLREIEDSNAANKSKRWLNEQASPKQKQHLRAQGVEVSMIDFSWTKYRAACALNFLWNKRDLEIGFRTAERKVA